MVNGTELHGATFGVVLAQNCWLMVDLIGLSRGRGAKDFAPSDRPSLNPTSRFNPFRAHSRICSHSVRKMQTVGSRAPAPFLDPDLMLDLLVVILGISAEMLHNRVPKGQWKVDTSSCHGVERSKPWLGMSGAFLVAVGCAAGSFNNEASCTLHGCRDAKRQT